MCKYMCHPCFYAPFFFNVPTAADIHTLSLHDALPISILPAGAACRATRIEGMKPSALRGQVRLLAPQRPRSEEHTSELQSPMYLVCRLLLEKKKHTGEMQETDKHQTYHDKTTPHHIVR